MSMDESFPPIDPVSSLSGPMIVVPRGRRRFGQRSRELYNQLHQIQKEWTDSAPPAPPRDSSFPIEKNHPRFDKLV